SARRGNVGFFRAGPGRKVEELGDEFRFETAAVIANGDRAVLSADLDVDLRSYARLFGLIQSIVDQLFQNDDRPGFDGLSGLCNELALGTEVQQPRCHKRYSLEPRRCL